MLHHTCDDAVLRHAQDRQPRRQRGEVELVDPRVGREEELQVGKLPLDALETGRLSGAIVDFTDPESLPPGHLLWTHPKAQLTPHIAGMMQPETAAELVLDNIRRHQAGASLVGLVDRSRG